MASGATWHFGTSRGGCQGLQVICHAGRSSTALEQRLVLYLYLLSPFHMLNLTVVETACIARVVAGELAFELLGRFTAVAQHHIDSCFV